MTPKALISKLDRKRLALRLDVQPHALNMAVSRGKLPPSWWKVVSAECAEAGIECPPCVFAFRDAAE